VSRTRTEHIQYKQETNEKQAASKADWRTTRRYMQEGSPLHNHHYENTKSNIIIFILFNYAFHSSDYMAQNERMILEWWIEKDMERSDRDLIWCTILAFASRDSETTESISHDSPLRSQIWTHYLPNKPTHSSINYEWGGMRKEIFLVNSYVGYCQSRWNW
jgi:hypothetical protein